MIKNEYIVLARKYRPKRFSDIIGQDEVCSVIEGAIKLNRVAHAFLFSGTRQINLGLILFAIDIISSVNAISKLIGINEFFFKRLTSLSFICLLSSLKWTVRVSTFDFWQTSRALKMLGLFKPLAFRKVAI